MNKYSLSALVAAGLLAGGMFAGSASAADLGGDCCADLEERVAELEATTARKGNRKVSLTISGWVGEQVMYWDDGVEENVYQTGLGTTLSSNFKFSGTAQITPGWSAGYLIHVEVGTSDSLLVNANNEDTGLINNGFGSRGTVPLTGGSIEMIQSYWFLKSEQLGKVSVGQLSQASDNTAILVDGSGTLVPANWVAFDFRAFAVRTTGGGVSGNTWGASTCRVQGGALGDCNGLVANGVRYDSPTFGGFSVSAGWGEDDFWDVAARWAGELGGFKLAAAASYVETNEFIGTQLAVGANTVEYFQAGVYAQHIPTGLFVLYNYGLQDESRDSAPNGVVPAPEQTTHYVKAGLRTKVTPLGATIFYGEYLNNEDGHLGNAGATGSQFDLYGGGIVQEIDAAAMSMWLKYRHMELDDNTATSMEDFQYVAVGALIAF